jgi:hypothetical protein
MSNGHRWETSECPAIFVSCAPAVGRDPDLAHWVTIGAEEEGVPCREVEGASSNALELAYAAAQSSHIGVGVGISREQIVLQEAHMPPDRPVMLLALDGSPTAAGRLAGGNAGRLVKRMPLRFPEDIPVDLLPAQRHAPEASLRQIHQRSEEMDSAMLNQIIERVLKRRGI